MWNLNAEKPGYKVRKAKVRGEKAKQNKHLEKREGNELIDK